VTSIRTPAASYRASFDLGEVVYHRAAEEREKGIVTGIILCPHGIYYWITWPDRTEGRHYELELTADYEADYSKAE
jgi:hypothetical protein